MTFDLHAALPFLIPKAIDWAMKLEKDALQSGAVLDVSEIALARRVGVMYPERIRIRQVRDLPMPGDPLLNQAAMSTGLLGPNMVGLTLGYSIYIRDGYKSIRLLSHEFRHVFQYEKIGSIADFLPEYLGQIVAVGYENAPLEIDARDHEIFD